MPLEQLSVGELDGRLAAVRDSMARSGLDGLLVADPANIYYLSGYNAWSFYTPQVLYVPAEGEPVLAMREMDALGAHRTALKYSQDVLGYPETFVHRPDTHPMVWIAQQLRDRGLVRPGRRVGIEGDAHFFSVRSYLALRDGLPEWTLVECNELVNWVRLVKSDFEIGLMRKAGKVASASMQRAIEAVQEGRPLNEVAAEIQAAQAQGGDGADGDYPAIVPMFPTDTPHLTWTAQPIAAGAEVSIELAGVHHRYHAPLARTLTFGTPSTQMDRLAGATVEGFNAALEMLRPGNSPADVTREWDRVLRRYDLEKKSRLGYSIGIGYPPDWGERTVSLRAEDTTVFKENMTFHMIAGMWMTGYGFEVSESVRVSSGAAEVLTEAPRCLIVKDS